jgi:hypothetical protein
MSKRLAEMVQINSKFCRSINIYQDLGDAEILKGFICPNSFKIALKNIADNISATGQSAFTWTGPYGAGKSSLALLLTAMLCDNRKLRDISKNIIGKELTTDFYKKVSIEKGWQIIPVIGEQQKAENLLNKKLEIILNRKIGNVFEGIDELVHKSEGVLIIIDEMGKCLEAAAKGIEDIYFYQQLAEYSVRSKGRIILIGILHQSFADYARYLPHTMRDEWIKVQGRFLDVPINTAGEEQIELIGKAIASKNHNEKYIKSITKSTIDVISRNKVIVSTDSLSDRYNNCWPINPVVVSLLGQISRKKFGQNQRSIFSFLASGEPKAFRDFITTTEYNDNVLYMPKDLFEYIRINLESSILASSDSRLWHIAIDALARCQAKGLSDHHINILKTIAIIDLFSSSSGIVADNDLLIALYPELKNRISTILEDLLKLSVVIYKKHRKAYSIYEGSDFDIEAALDEGYTNITELDISKLDTIAGFKPIIAKRYYHQFGSMRWFDVSLTPVGEYRAFLQRENKKSKAVGIFSILLPETTEEEKSCNVIVKEMGRFDFPIVFTIASNIRLIIEYLKELLAIEWVQKNRGELAGDSIARREIEDRRQIVVSLLEVQLNLILQNSEWYYKGEKKTLTNNELSSLASQICEEEYYNSPIIKSELVNRTKPSSNAVAAINALLHDMILNNGTENLGIEGFTPEAGLYNILIKDTGLYQQLEDGEFRFIETKRRDLKPIWKITDKLLKNNNYIPATDIYDMWIDKPLGIKEGLHSFFLLSYLLTRGNNVAVYRDSVYVPEINDLLVDYMIDNPKSISLKMVKTDEISDNILLSLIQIINEIDIEKKLETNSTPLIVAQRLVSIIDRLHPWVLKTRTLSSMAVKLRELIKNANDPNKLIFDDLSKLFSNESFHDRFKTTLHELIDVYPALIQSIGILITSELDIPLATPAYLEKLKERANNIKGVSGDFKINAFAARLSAFSASINDIAGLISLANNKPPKDWIDLDIENAKKELLHLCIEFKKAELYTKVKERPSSRQAMAFVAGIGGKTEIVTGEFDLLIEKKREVQKLKEKLSELIGKEKDINLILTALAETSIDYLKKAKK